MTNQEKYADRIAKLLRKAESTTAEEAEALVAKAQELMTKYAIDEAMLDAARGLSTDEIEQREFVHTGIFRNEMGRIAAFTAHYNNCRVVLLKDAPRIVEGKARKQTYIIVATGFKSDLARVAALNASLQIQAMSSQTRWWKENEHHYLDKSEMYWGRRQFITSFGNAIANKLKAATERGKAQAIKDWAERTDQEAGEASTSVEMVLVSRKDQVDRWMDEHYGDSLTANRERSKKPGDRYAHEAGTIAGRAADVGQPGVGGDKKQLS